MEDPDFKRLASITDRLFMAAANAHEMMEFLRVAVSLLETDLGSSQVMIVEARNGIWSSLLPSASAAPSTLLATVADTLEPSHDNDWLAVPLLGPNQKRSKATPQILLAASKDNAKGSAYLQQIAARLSGLLHLAATRTDAERALRRQQLLTDLQRVIRENREDTQTITDWLARTLRVDNCYVFTWNNEKNQFTSAASDESVALPTQFQADHLKPALLFQTDDDLPQGNGKRGEVRAELHCVNELCSSLADVLDQPVATAMVARVGFSASKPASAAKVLVIARREDATHTFQAHDLADFATLSRELAIVSVAQPNADSDEPRLLGESDAIQAVRDRIERIAPTELSALIMGENGTGKEVVSRQIHALSARSESPFLAVNCGALTETLLESELFGHEKGAFTDAHEARAGKFEAASGGTLFLDEVGELAASGQVKLLRVLEEKIVVRVGGTQHILTDARILAATNRDLGEMVREGNFREDLFFRLNAVTIELPPLRDRPSDVEPLATHFLSSFAAKADRPALRLASDSLKRLKAHAWPGNVRELRNLMERVVFLAKEDEIVPTDLGLPEPSRHDSIENLNEATRDFQVAHIESQITAAAGNMTEAAQRLGLHRSNLYRKMKQLGMQTDQPDEPESS